MMVVGDGQNEILFLDCLCRDFVRVFGSSGSWMERSEDE